MPPLRQVLPRQKPLWKVTPSALHLQQWLIAAAVAVQHHISPNFSQMSIWPSIPCSPPEDLQISRLQQAIRDFEASLHQREVETAADNKKAKGAHSKRDLRARVKCAKAVMKAKYKYHMAIQEARAERCTELEESEATYSKTISENVVAQSLQCAMLCQEHTEHMWELEACTLRVENKSCQDFLIVHQTVLHQAPQTLKEDLHSSFSLLLGPLLSSHQSLMLTPAPQAEGWPLSTIPLKPEPKQPLPQRGDIHLWR